jgi:hypothetical protein
VLLARGPFNGCSVAWVSASSSNSWPLWICGHSGFLMNESCFSVRAGYAEDLNAIRPLSRINPPLAGVTKVNA